MFKNLLLVGLLAGVLSGSLLTLLQAVTVIPLIHQAEQYEIQFPVMGSETGHHGHDGPVKEWGPGNGWERLAFTWLANVSIAAGFGLMMAGIMSLHSPKTWTQAVLFGVAGYYAFFLAPAFLLPPELPGSDASHLQSRQAIWLYTVVVSLVSMALVSFSTRPWLRLLGLVSLASPFLLFTREDVRYSVPVPFELIEQFTRMTAVTNALLWATIGLCVRWLFLKVSDQSMAQSS